MEESGAVVVVVAAAAMSVEAGVIEEVEAVVVNRVRKGSLAGVPGRSLAV
jgi:hypothetical protein